MDSKTKINNTKTSGKYLSHIIFLPLFFILSYLIPKNRKLVLLGSGFGLKYMGNPKYFYLYLIEKKKSQIRPYWITRNKEIYNALKGQNLPVTYLYSIKGFLLVLFANLFIVEQSSQDIVGTSFIVGNFRIINMWHGNFVKVSKVDSLIKEKDPLNTLLKYFIKKEQKGYLLCVCCSQFSHDKMKDQLKNNNVQILGYPRNDILLSGKLNRGKKQVPWKTGEFKTIILYAPTFRDHTKEMKPFTNDFIKRFNEYLIQNSILFLFRGHPLDDGKLEIPEESNIVNVSQVDDVVQILSFTDILITDYSSIVADFCLTKRPIIFYPYDLKEYETKSRAMYFDYFKENIGPFAHNEEELLQLLQQVNTWSKSRDYKGKYAQFLSKFHFYKDDLASERIYRLIVNNLL